MESLGAGKDVYLEKPMFQSIEEGARMVKVVRATDGIMHNRMQRRPTSLVR